MYDAGHRPALPPLPCPPPTHLPHSPLPPLPPRLSSLRVPLCCRSLRGAGTRGEVDSGVVELFNPTNRTLHFDVRLVDEGGGRTARRRERWRRRRWWWRL